MRAVIVDDERTSRTRLTEVLQVYQGEIHVLGEADSVETGIELIEMTRPNLVFLDVEMPPYTGFDLLDYFPQPDFSIIFTTAYTKYAIDAIRASAVDYLLKPISLSELKMALLRAEQVQGQSELISLLKHNLQKPAEEHKIALPSADEYIFIDKTNILYLEAARQYTSVYTTEGEQVVSKPLRHFTPLLQEPYFFRSHRSYIVNLKHVKKWVRHGGGYIEMRNGDQVKLSPSLKKEFILHCKRYG